MNPRIMQWATELLLGSAFLHPHAALLQSPGMGRLVIQSNPQGANIFINDKPMGQTPATYVVGPGNYTVRVTGGAGNLNCGDKSVYVSPGSAVTVTCPDNWK
jgi:PEGA domain